MSVKTSLQVKTFNPVTNKNVTKTATYSNPNATDAQLNSFAQNFYGGLSDNTVNSVVRVDKQDITNAEPEPTGTYALWTPSAEFYDINNADFMNALGIGGRQDNNYSVNSITSIYALNDKIQVDFTRRNDDTGTVTVSGIHWLIGDIHLTYTSSTGTVSTTTVDDHWSDMVELTQLSLNDIATMIGNNKAIELIALYIEKFAESFVNQRRLQRINVSYVQATNSIRVDPVEGVEDNFYIYFASPAQVYALDNRGEPTQEIDPAYYDGRILGHNTTFKTNFNDDPSIVLGITD